MLFLFLAELFFFFGGWEGRFRDDSRNGGDGCTGNVGAVREKNSSKNILSASSVSRAYAHAHNDDRNKFD